MDSVWLTNRLYSDIMVVMSQFWRKQMNYYIEKHESEIIVDALELLYAMMQNQPSHTDDTYSKEDVEYLFRIFDDNHVEHYQA